MKNAILLTADLFCGIVNQINLSRKHVHSGKELVINGVLHLHGNGTLRIGSGVQINSSEISNPIGGMSHMIISVYGDACVQIGDHTGISNSAINCRSGIVIGDHTKIGGDTKIYDSDFHSLDPAQRMNGETDVPAAQPIFIGNHVFIGAHSIILKGVHIGDYSIVGAGSVVVHDIPSRQVWAGNPARFIRELDSVKI